MSIFIPSPALAAHARAKHNSKPARQTPGDTPSPETTTATATPAPASQAPPNRESDEIHLYNPETRIAYSEPIVIDTTTHSDPIGSADESHRDKRLVHRQNMKFEFSCCLLEAEGGTLEKCLSALRDSQVHQFVFHFDVWHPRISTIRFRGILEKLSAEVVVNGLTKISGHVLVIKNPEDWSHCSAVVSYKVKPGWLE